LLEIEQVLQSWNFAEKDSVRDRMRGEESGGELSWDCSVEAKGEGHEEPKAYMVRVSGFPRMRS